MPAFFVFILQRFIDMHIDCKQDSPYNIYRQLCVSPLRNPGGDAAKNMRWKHSKTDRIP